MKDILDQPEDLEKISTNNRKWAFGFFILLLTKNPIYLYLFSSLRAPDISYVIAYLDIFYSVIRLLGIIFTVRSIIKKEKRNYLFWVPVLGFSFLLLFHLGVIIYYKYFF